MTTLLLALAARSGAAQLAAPPPGAPAFRLTYRVLAPDCLAVGFEIAPPGSDAFKPYVRGVMRRSGGR